MKRGNEQTDYNAYLKLLVYCCVALFVCKCLCHSLYILMRRLLQAYFQLSLLLQASVFYALVIQYYCYYYYITIIAVCYHVMVNKDYQRYNNVKRISTGYTWHSLYHEMTKWLIYTRVSSHIARGHKFCEPFSNKLAWQLKTEASTVIHKFHNS